MASQSSNAAKQIQESEVMGVDEPSMDEILASIKKIISDDERADANLQDRAQYTHPTDHSNSNELDAEIEADLEADLEAAIEMELMEIAADEAENAGAEGGAQSTAGKSTAQEADPVRAKAEVAEDAPSESLEEKAEKVREKLSADSSGPSIQDRLEKYRVRGKLKMETLAQRPVEPVASAAPPPVAPAVAAGPVLPTTHTIAQEMANTMLAEKEQEIQTLLANIMRPTIRKWLGENLPVMVEKLVREEIERVSRGKQAS